MGLGAAGQLSGLQHPDRACRRRSAASGWDACNTASNHSLDQGQEGIEQTGAALDQQRIEHTGSFVSARGSSAGRWSSRSTGSKVGLLAYTDMTNGIPLPEPVVGQRRPRSTTRPTARRSRSSPTPSGSAEPEPRR